VPNIENMKKEIIEIVDKNWNPWVKAAFYSDPEVEAILTELYEVWEKENRRGIPLDYASYEQLEILYFKAQEYRDADATTVARELLWEGKRTSPVRRPRSWSEKLVDYLKRLGLILRR